MTIAEAVRQMVSLGERDPYVISTKLVKRHRDESWFRDDLIGYANEFVATMAAKQISAELRSATRALRKGDAASAQRLKERTVWIPEVGRKRFADCTIEDLRAKRDYYAQLGRTLFSFSAYYESCAMLLLVENVATVGDVTAPLPEFPRGSQLADMAETLEIAA